MSGDSGHTLIQHYKNFGLEEREHQSVSCMVLFGEEVNLILSPLVLFFKADNMLSARGGDPIEPQNCYILRIICNLHRECKGEVTCSLHTPFFSACIFSCAMLEQSHT